MHGRLRQNAGRPLSLPAALSAVGALFLICNFSFAVARPGALQTRDGKRHEGEIAFAHGAVQISNDVTVASIPRGEISRLSFDAETIPSSPGAKGEGLGLLGYYFANTNVQGPVQVRLDPMIDFDWGMAEPLAGLGKDYFAIIWMGYLEAPGSGEFTFTLTADDNARLQIGADLVIESSRRDTESSGALALEQGRRYPVTLLYQDLVGAAKIRLLWSGPDLPKSTIPADRLYPASFVTEHAADIQSSRGLLATTYEKADFSGKTTSRVDRIVEATTQPTRWTGQVRADYAEPYSFFVATDGPVRLRLNGKPLIDQWTHAGLAELKGTTRLSAGQFYDVELEALAPARLLWSSPSQPKCLVPETHLVPFKKIERAPSALGPNPLLPAGVLLRNGSFVACRVESIEEDIVQCSRWLAGRRIPVQEVARMVCQPLPRAAASRVNSSRPGVLLANGDFVEGAFVGMEGTQVTISSVLFGLRTYNTTQQVLAVIIREAEGPPPPCEIQMRDQSLLFAADLELHAGSVVLDDKLLAGLRISEDDIHTIHFR